MYFIILVFVIICNMSFHMQHRSLHGRRRGYSYHRKGPQQPLAPLERKPTKFLNSLQLAPLSNPDVPAPLFHFFFRNFTGPSCWTGCLPCQYLQKIIMNFRAVYGNYEKQYFLSIITNGRSDMRTLTGHES